MRKRKRQQRKSKSVHIKCFSASEKRLTPCLSVCAMSHFLLKSVSMHHRDIRHHSAPVDKWSIQTAAAGPLPDRTEAQRKVTFPRRCKWIGMYNNQGRSCFFCCVLIAWSHHPRPQAATLMQRLKRNRGSAARHTDVCGGPRHPGE